MCASDSITSTTKEKNNGSSNSDSNNNGTINNFNHGTVKTTTIESLSADNRSTIVKTRMRKRRSKYDRNALVVAQASKKKRIKKKKKNPTTDNSSSFDSNKIITTLLPSLIGVIVGLCALAAKLGFRGRATVAGIDLGTTNSVICVQAQASSIGEIICIPDSKTNSSIIPSVVSIEKKKGSINNNLIVVVGDDAKQRIDTHPHSTVYHAKRVIGRKFDDRVISELKEEVEFEILNNHTTQHPCFLDSLCISPEEIGSYVLNYLLDITTTYFGYSSITSAVITIPAEFTAEQRIATVDAYKLANIKVIRILEEPTAAALAYGLHKKEGVEHVLVYDFGGGTLDVSVLRIGQQGYVDVMGSAGDSNLGGADFDDALVKFILKQNNFVESFHNTLHKYSTNEELLFATCNLGTDHLCTVSSLHTMAERIKIQLSSNPNISTVTEYCLTFDHGIDTFSTDTTDDNASTTTTTDLCSKLNTKHEITITKDDFHQAVQHLYPRSVQPIRKVLHELDLNHHDIDEVVMVGGTTRMLHIRDLVKEEFHHIRDLNTQIDPDITVAYGAASVID